MLERRVEHEFPGRKVFVMSASTGAGVDEWLDYVMRESSGGERIAEVDYDTYAEGEAALGWLNASVELRRAGGADWKAFCAKFLRTVQSALRRRSAEIAHAKVLLKTPRSLIVANLTDSTARPSVRGDAPEGTEKVRFLINVRAHVDPATLRKIVESALRSCCRGGIMSEVRAIDSLSPGRPKPVYRYSGATRRMTNVE
jgi:hypothetical protein